MKGENIPELMKSVRSQLNFSQEDLARELGVSFATVNRWENGKVFPSKMAQAAFRRFCTAMIEAKKLKLPGVEL
jgi:DNA-binding transcriptional regulator YiaG